MVKIFYWEQRLFAEGSFGHVSMYVGGEYIGDAPPISGYISWWPQKHGRIFTHSIKNREYASDVAAEQRPPDPASLTLVGLDEEAIKTWWAKFRAEGHGWQLYDHSCAQTVADALRAGGAEMYVHGISGWWRHWNTIWSPQDVMLFAAKIQKGLNKKRESGEEGLVCE